MRATPQPQPQQRHQVVPGSPLAAKPPLPPSSALRAAEPMAARSSASRVAVDAVLTQPDCAAVLDSIAARVARAMLTGTDPAVYRDGESTASRTAALRTAYAAVVDRLAELTTRHLGRAAQSARTAAIQRAHAVPDPGADGSGESEGESDDDRGNPAATAAAATSSARSPKLKRKQQHQGLSISFIRRAGTTLSRSLPGSPTRSSSSLPEEDPHARSFTNFKRPNKRARQGSSSPPSSAGRGASPKTQHPAARGTHGAAQQHQQQQQFGVIANRQARWDVSRDGIPRHTTEMVLTSAVKARAVSGITKIVATAASDAAKHVALQLREQRAAAAAAPPTLEGTPDTSDTPDTAGASSIHGSAGAMHTNTTNTTNATNATNATNSNTGSPASSTPSAKSAMQTVTIQAASYVTEVVGAQLRALAKKLLATAVPEVATNCTAIVAQLLKPDSVNKIVLKTASLLHVTLQRVGIAPGAAAAIAKTVGLLIQARASKPTRKPTHTTGLGSRQCNPITPNGVQLSVSHAGKENSTVDIVAQ